jgi:hypothetical protein
VLLKVIKPVALQTTRPAPLLAFKLPEHAMVPVPAKVSVPLGLVMLISKQVSAPVKVTVNVPGPAPDPEASSKNTLSAAVGLLAPLGPPEEADQLAVLLVFHCPAPPTQYLSAMYYPVIVPH